MIQLQALLGLFVFVLLAWLLSENRQKFSLRLVLAGIGLQFLLAAAFLHMPVLSKIFLKLNGLLMIIEKAASDGGAFMFGYLGGAVSPFSESGTGSTYIVAFRIMPVILLVSALSSLLFYCGIIQMILRAFSLLLRRTLKISGLQGLAVSSSVFLGIVETPIFLQRYVEKMSRSTLFLMMTSSMATVAGTVMVLYASVLRPVIPDAMTHIIVASIISAPAAVVLSLVIIPDNGDSMPEDYYQPENSADSAFSAIIQGTQDGLQLVLGIIAMIIVLFSLISVANQMLGILPLVNGKKVTVELLASIPFFPVVWLMGIPFSECGEAARLMGIKTILNEFVSYQALAGVAKDVLSEKTKIILTYSMCGFANLASLALLTGCLAGIAPKRKQEIVALGLKSLISGTLAACMTGCIIGIIR